MADKDLLMSMLSKLENSVETIHKDVSVIKGNMAKIDSTLVKQEAHLEEHIRRTEASEARLDVIEKSLVPLQHHVVMFSGAGKLLTIVATLIGMAAAVYKMIT